jgi:hypothetical protein
MAEAGAIVYEIGAVLAHAETKTTGPYTEKTDRRKLAIEAARKRENAESVPTPGKGGTLDGENTNIVRLSRKKWQP